MRTGFLTPRPGLAFRRLVRRVGGEQENKRGNVVCEISGDYTGGCLTLVGCGASQTSC